MNNNLVKSVSHNWNGMNQDEINQVSEFIYNNDGERVYDSNYNRWYFYKFSDGSFRISRLTWDNAETVGVETFNDLLSWLNWYYT